MSGITVTADIMGILICMTVLYGNCFEHIQKNDLQKKFTTVTLSVIAITAADTLTYLLSPATAEWILYSLYIITYIGNFIISSAIIMYIHSYIIVNFGRNLKRFMILNRVMIVAVLLSLAGCLTKKVFFLQNGELLLGELYPAYVFLHILLMVAILFVFCSAYTLVGIHDFIALISYMVFPGILLLIKFENLNFSIVYAGFSLAILIMYIMLQGNTQQRLFESRLEESVKATHDPVTGLLNRRAYEEMCKSFKGGKSLGVIFCDINGLKYTNDHIGHSQGDMMLTKFAQIVVGCCRKEEIFRIGGDEFVVLIAEISKSAFENRVSYLIEAVSKGNKPLASVGAAFGIQQDAELLIAEAETEMYKEKKKFHDRYTEYLRG